MTTVLNRKQISHIQKTVQAHMKNYGMNLAGLTKYINIFDVSISDDYICNVECYIHILDKLNNFPIDLEILFTTDLQEDVESRKKSQLIVFGGEITTKDEKIFQNLGIIIVGVVSNVIWNSTSNHFDSISVSMKFE